MISEAAENQEIFLNWRPNRSLDRSQRRCCQAAIIAPVLLIAVGITYVGAWLVLPFAGLEILLVWWAFRVLERHDEDYEMLDVSLHHFCWERREWRTVKRLSGNPLWAQVVWLGQGDSPILALRYGGRSVLVGTQLCDEERLKLAVQLDAVFHRR